MASNSVPVKIVHVVSGDLWAGAEVQAYQLCLALKQRENVEVGVITFNSGTLADRLRQGEIPVHVVDETQLSAPLMVYAITKILRHERPEVVHTHGQKENILGSAAAVISRVPACIRTVHGNPENRFHWRRPHKPILKVVDFLAGRFFQNAIIAVSEQLRERMQGSYPGKVHKINNFIDVDSLRQSHPPAERRKTRQARRIGLVGRLVPVKRVDLFLETVKILRTAYLPDIEALVIGDGPLRAQLISQAKALEIDDIVSFSGFVDPVYPLLSSLDVLVMPSDHEGLPMVLIEAQALEVPVVAHAVGGIPEALANGQAGYLVQDHSPAGYAQVIATALGSPHTDENLGLALANVRANFGWTTNTEEYLRLYRSL